jgi:hypothetical protein
MILNGRADDELMPEHLERPALRGGMNRGGGYGSRRSNAGLETAKFAIS